MTLTLRFTMTRRDARETRFHTVLAKFTKQDGDDTLKVSLAVRGVLCLLQALCHSICHL
jgi:hypothetical protein